MWKFFSLLALCFFLSACGVDNGHFLKQKMHVADHTFWIEVAQTQEQQVIGLSKHDSLADDEGMLFIYPKKQFLNFWMKDMNFPIDLLWLDDQTIVGYEKNMPQPVAGVADKDLPSYASPREVNQVLELPAGTIERLNIQLGDQVY